MEDRGSNVINNYKGVMLCSRPNEINQAPVQKPFCGRVFNHEQIGLVPVKNDRSPVKQIKKAGPTILSKHKKWLEQFKQKQAKSKQQIEERARQEEERLRKIKQLAELDRERAKKMKNEYNQTATQVLNILDDSTPAPSRPGELNPANLRKLDEQNAKKQSEPQRDKHTEELFKKHKHLKRPQWALTSQEKQKKDEEEVDELLDFFDSQQITQYTEDEQVKSILKNLKQKIQQIKEKQDWREREANKLRQRQQRNRANREQQDEDKVTNYSARSEAKSIASEKAQKNIEDLKKRKEEPQDWDKHTTTSKQSFANIDEKIAKNLADEVLRNYPHLRGVHSNTSIRKLLESEAAKAINEPIPRPVITTIMKQPRPLDVNNLPCLYRNPSI